MPGIMSKLKIAWKPHVCHSGKGRICSVTNGEPSIEALWYTGQSSEHWGDNAESFCGYCTAVSPLKWAEYK